MKCFILYCSYRCVQSRQPIEIWKNIFYLCNDPLVLSLFVVVCLAVVLTTYFFQQFEDTRSSSKWDCHRLTLSGISCLFGFASEYKPKFTPTRIFFGLSLFGCMIYTISTMSIMFKFITKPIYKHQIQSVQEIIDQRFHLIGDEFALQHLIRQNEVISSHFLLCLTRII